MSPSQSLLLLRAGARVARRRIVEHAFVLFALGPLVLGALFWVAQRYVQGLRQPLIDALTLPDGASWAADVTGRPALILASIVALCLWPGSLRALFGRGDDPIDALPVAESTRLAVAWIESVVRALVPAVVLAGAASVLAVGQLDLGITVARWPACWAAMVVLASVDLVLAVVAVHVGRATLGHVLGAAVLVAGVIAVPWVAVRWLLLPFGIAGALARSALVGETSDASPWLAAGAVVAVALVALIVLVPRWRRRDLERARASDTPRRRSLRLPIVDRLPAPVAAQLRRDLRLIARRFSPAVSLAVGTAVVALVVTAALAADTMFEESIRRGGLVLGAAIAVLAVVSIVPFLLKHQLPMLWLERSLGVEPQAVWRTKAVLAGVLAVPPALAGVLLVVFVGPADPWLQATTAGRVVLAAFAVAATVGVASFEIAEEPLLSLLFTGLTGLAVAVLYVAYAPAWWLWLGAHLYLLSIFAGHAPRRVRFTEVER